MQERAEAALLAAQTAKPSSEATSTLVDAAADPLAAWLDTQVGGADRWTWLRLLVKLGNCQFGPMESLAILYTLRSDRWTVTSRSISLVQRGLAGHVKSQASHKQP